MKTIPVLMGLLSIGTLVMVEWLRPEQTIPITETVAPPSPITPETRGTSASVMVTLSEIERPNSPPITEAPKTPDVSVWVENEVPAVDTDEEVRLVASLTAKWAVTEPVKAAEFAINLPPGRAKREAVISVSSAWARQEPRAAIQWAAEIPPGPLQEDAYTQVVFAWTQTDPVTVTEWMLALPEGTVRDIAFSAFSGAIIESHPQIALSMAEGISSDELRQTRLENIAHRWLQTDPDENVAAAALADSSLPDSVLRRLLQP